MKIAKLTAILAILLILVACGKKAQPESETTPAAIQPAVKVYSQLPSFKDVFKVLSEFEAREVANAIPGKQFKIATKDVPKSSFNLGTLTADAIIAVRSRDKAKLLDMSKEMLNLSSILGLDQEINLMAAEINAKIEKEQWTELEEALDGIKSKVEDKLYGLDDGDSYTFMLFGGWNEAINRVAYILTKSYDVKKTTVLSQKGTLNTLISNLEKVEDPATLNEMYYKDTLANLREIKLVIDADKDKTYTKDQIKQLFELSDKIKQTIAK